MTCKMKRVGRVRDGVSHGHGDHMQENEGVEGSGVGVQNGSIGRGLKS